MHPILPLTWTTALCLWTLPPSSHSTLNGADVVLLKELSSTSDNENFLKKDVDVRKPTTLKCFAKLDGAWSVELDWYKNNESLSKKCASPENVYNDTNKKTNEISVVPRCDVFKPLDETIEGQTGKSLSIRINNVSYDDFGKYTCQGNFTPQDNQDVRERETVIQEIHLRETIGAARKNEKGKRQRSVVVYEGDILYIYCNFTGTKQRDDVHVTWFKDGQDITEDYLNGHGNFTCSTNNTVETSRNKENNMCERIANIEKHRGWYICQVNIDGQKDPVSKHEYLIRVKVASSLLYPGVILVIEIVVLAIITAVTWKNTTGENKLDGNDWEDDDENEHDENYVADEELEDLTSKPLTSN